jgi:hypothetical protein
MLLASTPEQPLKRFQCVHKQRATHRKLPARDLIPPLVQKGFKL